MTTIGYGDRTPFTQPARFTVLFLMIWGAVWNAIFISTVFPIITLNDEEFKAFNLFERIHKRNDLEDTASVVVSNSIQILRELNSKGNGPYDVDKLDKNQLKCLQYMRKLSKLRKEMDSLVIETLYFEDDMLTKLELVLELNEKVTAIQLKIEDVYRQIFEIPGFAEATLDENGNPSKEFDILKESKLDDLKSIKSKRRSTKSDDDIEKANNFVTNFDAQPDNYLEPDSQTNLCRNPNLIKMESMTKQSLASSFVPDEDVPE